ncbi:MAG: hypothetical protein K9K64_15570 [Desulfohalobiaceae bacterium]|nr:hypothetical protein [Desulfohalobiaceae bacterium]
MRISPSHKAFDRMGDFAGVGTPQDPNYTAGPQEIPVWPAEAKSLVVVALEHPRDKPELDWWDGKQGTPGNRQLIKICKSLRQWVKDNLGLQTYPMHYYVQKGGTFLKDAAVMAGLGCIGKNNQLITPEFGPRVRLRSFMIQAELPPSAILDFDPCQDCPAPCRTVCPVQAMHTPVWTTTQLDTANIPARDGSYSRKLCNIRMEMDIQESESDSKVQNRIRYCRKCEFACIAGRRQ